MDFPATTVESTDRIHSQQPDGETATELYVDTERHTEGSTAEFFPAYTDESHSNRYGFVCGSCRSTAVSMDTMGRLSCQRCENERAPTQWDAAYL